MRALIRLRSPLSWSLFALGAAVTHAACGGGDASGPALRTTPPVASTAIEVDAGIVATDSTPDASTPQVAAVVEDDPWSVDWDQASCHGDLAQCNQHATDAVEALGALVDVEQTKDKRSVPIALDAVRGRDADIVVEGLRILGPFPREPGVYAGVLPRLIDPRPVVRRLAARILKDTQEGYELGRQYEQGHEKMGLEGVPSDAHDAPRTPSTWGFAPLARATPYPPADSPMSLGYSTTASVDEVATFYAQQAGARRMNVRDYRMIRQKVVADAAHGSEMKEMQALQQEIYKSHKPPDAATQRKIKELADKMQASMSAANDPTPYPPDSRLSQGQFVVLTMTSTLPERWVAIYKEPAYDRTIAILAWSAAISPAPLPTPAVLRNRAQ